ncbi:MAG: flagellin [bacterium]|nr:flagellin [bacterium]
MSTRINHNILSLTGQRNIYQTQQSLETAINRLSSGLRINNSWDDPAGLAVSERFRAQIDSMAEAEKNMEYSINMLATAEGSLSVIDEKLIRLRALSVQASNGTLTDNDRASLDVEFQQLKSEITRIANVTNYNGIYLLNGAYSGSGSNGIKLHIGTYNTIDNDYYYITMGNMTASALGIDSLNVLNTVNSQSAITALDVAINSKDSERTRLGSYVNRLRNSIMNIQITHENAVASESQIRDADIAAEMSAFLRSQILMQTGVSMLAQANQVPQIVSQLVG